MSLLVGRCGDVSTAFTTSSKYSIIDVRKDHDFRLVGYSTNHTIDKMFAFKTFFQISVVRNTICME